MRSLETIRATTPKMKMFQGQLQHVMLVVLITSGTVTLLHNMDGSFLGLSTKIWAFTTIAVVLLHQSIVAIVFRLQLHFAVMTRLLGERALKIWGIIFMPLLLARPLLLLATGLSEYGSLAGPRTLQLLVGTLLVAIAAWGAHSVIKYFTIPRALGGDHFYDRYLNMPLVNQGAFKVTPNAMYGIIFLGLWGLALLTGSRNALVLALFQHGYIWVHMYCTEDPDMRILYADTGKGQSGASM
jgi:phospholipid methyltransferase